MEDLSRFFDLLVRNLAAVDPARLRHPLPLREIRETILPYRANRRALQLESSEDYELVLIRLCGGEGSFARTEPDDIQAKFAAEARNSNPDLTIVNRHEDATVILNEAQVTRTLGRDRELAFAPPDQRFASPASVEPAPTPDPPPTTPLSAALCPACGGKLPLGRKVKFCPHCGEDQAVARCPQCQTQIDPSWRHCVSCGAAVQRD